MTYYKVLSAKQNSHHGGSGKWVPGKPRSVRGPIVPCQNGIHFCRRGDLVCWLGPEIWLFEDLSPDETVTDGNKLVTRRGMVVERLETWNERTARLFAADCAEKAVRDWQKASGKKCDPRTRAAIRAAREFANGNITAAELSAAESAAESAAWSAVESAARSAAWSAAVSAAESAGESAAESAARSAAESAAWSWQTKRLFEYLDGKRGT